MKFVWTTISTIVVGKPIRRCSIDTWMEKVPNCECLSVHRKQGLFLSVYVDHMKMAGKKPNMAPMVKKLVTHVDLGEPTSFLDDVYLGCTQRECKPNEIIIEQSTKMFESRISGATEKSYQDGKKITPKQ